MSPFILILIKTMYLLMLQLTINIYYYQTNIEKHKRVETK